VHRLPDEASFAEKVAVTQDGDDSVFSLAGRYSRQPGLLAV
jgi:hypothetical protein